MGECSATQDHLVQHLESSPPLHQVPSTGCVRCPHGTPPERLPKHLQTDPTKKLIIVELGSRD